VTVSALSVAIVGGGIGGLAAANALLQKGLDVTVYEQASALAEVGAGLTLQPNGVRMMRRLAFGAAVERWGARIRDSQHLRADGSFVGAMLTPETAERREMYGMHRADLLQMLVEALPPEVIHTGHRCVGFEQDAEQATVHFASGERASADVVVAADGIHSALQPYVVEPSEPLPAGSVAYRGVIPAASVGWPDGAFRNWIGAGKHFLVYPVRAGELINYVGFVQTDEQTRESWSAVGDPATLAREFAGWDSMVEAICAQVARTFWWGLYDREPLRSWSRGRLTLLGDAAHPMLPHAGQGANQAIEDGVALATILAQADRASVPEALQVYQSVRWQHTARVQGMARANGRRYDSAVGDLALRDRELGRQASDRAWIWDHDAEADARGALVSRGPAL